MSNEWIPVVKKNNKSKHQNENNAKLVENTNNGKNTVSNNKKTKNKPSTKQSEKQPKIEKLTVNDLFKKRLIVDEVELNLLKKFKEKLNSGTYYWLVDMSIKFNSHFSAINEDDSIFIKESPDFPIHNFEKDSRKILSKAIIDLKEEDVTNLYKKMFHSTLINIRQQKNTFGYRVLLQLLIMHHPRTILNIKSSLIDDFFVNLNQSNILSFYKWLLNQTLSTSPPDAFEVPCRLYMEVFVPHFEEKQLAEFIVSFSERLQKFAQKLNAKDYAGKAFTIDDFLFLLRMYFKAKGLLKCKKLVSNVGNKFEKFARSFHFFRRWAFEVQPPKALREYFPVIMDSVSKDQCDSIREEMLTYAIWCLEHSEQCSVLWLSLQDDYPYATKELLKKMIREKDNIKMTEVLRYTLLRFKNKPEIAALAGIILNHTKGGESSPLLSWGSTLKFLIFAMLLFLIIDYSVLHNFDCEQMLAYKFVQNNEKISKYGHNIKQLLQPYINLSLNYTTIFMKEVVLPTATFASDEITPYLKSLQQYLVPYLKRILLTIEVHYPIVLSYVTRMLDVVIEYSIHSLFVVIKLYNYYEIGMYLESFYDVLQYYCSSFVSYFISK